MATQRAAGWKALEPLRDATFRNIWTASLLSNFGQLVLGAAAAWERRGWHRPEWSPSSRPR